MRTGGSPRTTRSGAARARPPAARDAFLPSRGSRPRARCWWTSARSSASTTRAGPTPTTRTSSSRFGTSGHRGSPLRGSFTEAHILATTQAICDYRRGRGIDGPLYMGKDTHALSGPAERTALEVLAANGVETIIQREDGVTPTPVISRAILVHNRGRAAHLADGIVVTPSHNPPEDGGFKYNPPDGGPADTDVTALGPGPRQRAAAGGQRGRRARAVRARAPRRDHAPGRPRPALRERSAERGRHGRHPRRRAPARRSIRSAARRGPTGSRSTRSTGSTSRS